MFWAFVFDIFSKHNLFLGLPLLQTRPEVWAKGGYPQEEGEEEQQQQQKQQQHITAAVFISAFGAFNSAFVAHHSVDIFRAVVALKELLKEYKTVTARLDYLEQHIKVLKNEMKKTAKPVSSHSVDDHLIGDIFWVRSAWLRNAAKNSSVPAGFRDLAREVFGDLLTGVKNSKYFEARTKEGANELLGK